MNECFFLGSIKYQINSNLYLPAARPAQARRSLPPLPIPASELDHTSSPRAGGNPPAGGSRVWNPTVRSKFLILLD